MRMREAPTCLRSVVRRRCRCMRLSSTSALNSTVTLYFMTYFYARSCLYHSAWSAITHNLTPEISVTIIIIRPTL